MWLCSKLISFKRISVSADSRASDSETNPVTWHQRSVGCLPAQTSNKPQHKTLRIFLRQHRRCTGRCSDHHPHNSSNSTDGRHARVFGAFEAQKKDNTALIKCPVIVCMALSRSGSSVTKLPSQCACCACEVLGRLCSAPISCRLHQTPA